MFSSPRPILFSTELECPPFKEVAISSRDAARALYNKMFEPGSGFRYENIDLQASEPLLSTRRGDDGRSICQIASHTIRLEELNPEMPVDGFVDVVKTVLNALKGYWHLFMIQKCKVQCLAQPNVTRNPLGILANRIGNIGDKIMPFGRPPTFFGVRFRFQPWSPDEDADSDVADEKATENEASSSASVSGAGEQDPDTESPDNHAGIEEARGFVTVRFEPYQADPSQVWIEVAANYLAAEPVKIDDLSFVEKNILETCRFATDNCKRFLDQFDPKTNAGEDKS